jgi:hypothetical protein
MSTPGIISRSTGEGTFTGRYHHWDSYPHGLGVALVELYRGHFKRDLERMLHMLLDEHKSWSTIVHKDFTLKPGYTNIAPRPEGMSIEEFQNQPLNRRPQCHCHGARREEGFITDEKTDCCAEWAYVFEVIPGHDGQPEQKLLHVLFPERTPSGENAWKEAGRIDLDSADEIPWTVIECGENFERCRHVAEYHGIKSTLAMQTYLGNRPLEMRDAIAVEIKGKLLKLTGSGGDASFLNQTNCRFDPERKPFPPGTWVATCVYGNGRRVDLPIGRRADQGFVPLPGVTWVFPPTATRPASKVVG